MNPFDLKLLERGRCRIVKDIESDMFELRRVNGHDLTLRYVRSVGESWDVRIRVTAHFTNEYGEQWVLLHNATVKIDSKGYKFWSAAKDEAFDHQELARTENCEAITKMLSRKKMKK